MKKVLCLFCLVILLVLPVSAADQINYFDTAYLVPLSGGSTDYVISGQSVLVSCRATGSAVYAYFRFGYTGLHDLAGKRLAFSFTETSSGENLGQINIEFYLDGERVAIVYNAQGRPTTVTVPEKFDEMRFIFYSSAGGSVEAGDSVTYTDIKLMGDRDIQTDTGFAGSVGSAFGFLKTVASGLLNVVFSYKFMAAAILMPFVVWLIYRIILWFQDLEYYQVQDWTSYGIAGALKGVVKNRTEAKKKKLADLLLEKNRDRMYVMIDGKKYMRKGAEKWWKVELGGKKKGRNYRYMAPKQRKKKGQASSGKKQDD